MSNRFVFVRDEQWNGSVKIFKDTETGEGIAISRAHTFDRGDETMIFPYSLAESEVSDWGELYAGYGEDHYTALSRYEYDLS